MSRVVTLAAFLCACAPTQDGLSGDEYLGVRDDGPGDGGDGAPVGDAGGGEMTSGAAVASVSGWIATASPVEDDTATVAAGTLSARVGDGVVVCQHTDLVAPCGTLAGADGFAWDPAAASGTFRYALTSDGSDTLCRWTVSYALLGIEGGGTLVVSVESDGAALDGAATSVTIASDAAR